jgi:hypothetical protein
MWTPLPIAVFLKTLFDQENGPVACFEFFDNMGTSLLTEWEGQDMGDGAWMVLLFVDGSRARYDDGDYEVL